jgi:8-oxo-dGTP pyrophosphatase MutT (NUDIX family)
MSNKNNNTNLCNNCGKSGHLFHQCKLPITSYGVILFRPSLHGLQFLMVRRKDSFGYIDFIRGKYSLHNVEHIQGIINEMSNDEKSRLLSDSFENMWKNMWGESSSIQYRNEETASNKKFDLIKNGINNELSSLTLKNLIDSSPTNWNETEWEFPKGRRNYQEKDLDCALREFQEETGINYSNISLIENILPFEETFIGTNHKSYKYKYFLAYMNDTDKYSLQNYQKSEVSKIEWKTIDECLESIRPYNLEKKQLITNINEVLQEYRLYS